MTEFIKIEIFPTAAYLTFKGKENSYSLYKEKADFLIYESANMSIDALEGSHLVVLKHNTDICRIDFKGAVYYIYQNKMLGKIDTVSFIYYGSRKVFDLLQETKPDDLKVVESTQEQVEAMLLSHLLF